MKLWIACWNILKKDINTYYLKPPNISWGILFPVAWTLMQFIRSPHSLEIRELLAGVIGMSILFGTTSMLAVTITFERKGRSFDRLLLAPISLDAMVLAKISGAVLFGMVNAIWPLTLAAFMIDLSEVNWGLIMLSILLMAVASALLGLVIAVSAKEVFEAQTYSNFFRFPMLFLSGFFFPVADLPSLLRPLSYCLPLTYGADMLNHAITHGGFMNVGFNAVMLAGFSMLLFYISRWEINRKWIL